jgi:PEP-CTERM motif
MKVINWCKTLRIALLAGGTLMPGAVYAQNIPLGDPSFDAFAVPAFSPGPPAAGGFAYADTYRPTSAWVDDLDHNSGGYIQDDDGSNWLYDAAYAEGASTARKRPAPRTGNQAIHGFGYYSAQETVAVFEANKSYTFSIWAQGDSDASPSSSRIWLYVFDGAIPFTEANSLTLARYAPDTGDFANRTPGMTQAQSQANWRQINLTHHVRAGASEIGHPVGVGFWGGGDNAVDDASLRADPTQNFLMFLEVNTITGQAAIKNQTGETINIDYYEITSAGSSLNSDSWNSFQEQNRAGFPRGDGFGTGWEHFGNIGSKVVGESYLGGNSAVGQNANVGLGAAFRPGFAQDLVFQYGAVLGGSAAPSGDYNSDNRVDAADYVVWRKTIGTQAAYNTWRANFGATGGPTGPSTLVQGFVRYVTSGPGAGSAVPEPSTVIFVGMGLALLALIGRGKPEVT